VRAAIGCTVSLALAAGGAYAQPLPISAELHPVVVTPRTTLALALVNTSTWPQDYQVASFVYARPLGVAQGA
jgi:hypothetical protein